MPASEPKKLSGIFISYRRTDTPDAVGRIYDRLVAEFGKTRVFKDVDSIPLGQDFRGHLNDIVGGCAAVLAIIGPRWTDTRNAAGQRRLEDPDDFVRIELEAALARDIPVVPVLVGHATMPGTAELPTSLASMAFRQSIEVRPDPDFHNDATRLVSALRVIIDPDAPPVPSASGNVRTPIMRWIWPVAFAVAALAAAAMAMPTLRYLRQAPPPETRTEISTVSGVDVGAGMALSPDGKQIVFVAMVEGVHRLWLRPLAATTAQLLPGTEGATEPFWSPDSRSIGFFTPDALKRMDLGSNTAITLAPVTSGVGGSWNADGVVLFSQGIAKPLARIAATGGAVTEVTQLEKGAVVHMFPVFLPDGRRFVFASDGINGQGTYLGSLDGSAPVRLTNAYGEMAYLPSGWLLHWQFQQGVLVAQRLDADKPALVGAPVTLAGGRGVVSASANGLVAYWRHAFQDSGRQLKWISRTGGELGTIGAPDKTYFSPRVSPDGRRVAVSRGENDKRDIWLLDGERASRVTLDATGEGYPLWSPDGTSIVFSSRRPDAPGMYQKPADGAGEEVQLMKGDTGLSPSSWSADGRYLLYVYTGQASLDVGVLPMTGDRKPWVLLGSSFTERRAEFSPDGKWVAYESDESMRGRGEVYVRSFVVPGEGNAASAARGGKWQVSTAGGTYPKWSPDGKELYYINPVGELMAAPIAVAGASLTPGTPVMLFQMGPGGGPDSPQRPQYDVARDGRLLINTVVDSERERIPPIVLIQNWSPNAR